MPTTLTPRQQFEQHVARLVEKFNRQRAHYLSTAYNETDVRAEFIDPLFEALGWDVSNRAGHGPHDKEVIREKSEISGRSDYQFQLNGRVMFIVEAKAPHVPLERTDVVMQAKKYAWNSKETSIAAITDFEEFRLYDATVKPDPKHPEVGLIFATKYTEYVKPKTADDLWLLSKEAVAAGSIEQLLKMSSVKQRERLPVDVAFLDDLTAWREKLAKAVFKIEPEIDPADLNSVVQVFLDRLIFIRFAEDHGILNKRGLEDVARLWEHSGRHRSIVNDLNALFHEVNDLLNGEIFKPHRCEKIDWDQEAALVAKIIQALYDGPYRFDVIGVELLGSIYERYLGKTIRVTATRAMVDDKPEVRKAGGVYYTPKYIVDYIVEQTVGKLIEGKTPAQIAKLKILDPACGSGSFLLGAYQKLIEHHERYYAGKAAKRTLTPTPSAASPLKGEAKAHTPGEGETQLRLIDAGEGGEYRLPLTEKAAILRNNLFGVDIDPQAVEITMMSLYIKLLEGERGAILDRHVLPPLRDNIKCGNSLIGYDIRESGQTHELGQTRMSAPEPTRKKGSPRGATPTSALSEEDLERIKPFDWHSKGEGFGEILAAGGFDAVIGNPPYVRMESFKELKDYLKANYACHDERSDLYAYMIEKSHRLLSKNGRFGMIVSNKFLRANYGKPLRNFLQQHAAIERIVDFAGLPVFTGATVRTIVLVATRGRGSDYTIYYTPPLPVDRFETLATGAMPVEEAILDFTYEVSSSALMQQVWSFAKHDTDDLVNRLRTACVPLEKYCAGQIGYGIKSGLEEAFVIDERMRKEILRRDKKSSEIIKPYLNGRDVRRYYIDFKMAYLIYTHHGVAIKDYPAAEEHLKPFKTRLQKRATKQEWYELQQPQYNYAVYFNGPKIVFPDIAPSPRFALDEHGYYGSTTTFFIGLSDLYLLGLLNSRLSHFYFVETCAALEGKGEKYLRFKRQYVEGFPVRIIDFSDPADKARHDRMVTLVQRMLDLHQQQQAAGSEAARDRLQREINVTDEQIDALAYQLYGLTAEEIRIVEGKSK